MRYWLIVILSFVLFSAEAQNSDCLSTGFCDSVNHGITFKYKQRTQKFSPALNCAAHYYPELDGFNIEVKRKKITTMMAARPKRNFLWYKKENRSYVILITDKYNMNAEVLYDSMGSCAMTGILGHELSHIVAYSQKNNSELMLFGIKYVFNRRQIETETDILAIKHGFGDGIIEYNHYIQHSPWVNKNYLKRKSRYYLSVNELNDQMKDLF